MSGVTFRASQRLRSAVGAASIVLLAVVLSLVVFGRYKASEIETIYAKHFVLRGGVALLHDVGRLRATLVDAALTGSANAEQEQAIALSLDYLFVRLNGIDSALKDAQTDQSGRRLIDEINDLVNASDAVLAAPEPDFRALYRQVEPSFQVILSTTMAFVEERYQGSTLAIGEQGTALKLMTYATIITLWILALIAIGLLLSQQSAQHAQRKQRAAEERARYLAFFDPLTGLPNANRFAETVEAHLQKRGEGVLLLIHITDFNSIIDVYGAELTDRVLTVVADRLTETRDVLNAVTARIAGEEFAILLPEKASTMNLAMICETLCRAVSRPVEELGVPLVPHINIGVASLSALPEKDGHSFSALYRAARAAIHHTGSSSNFAFYDAELAAHLSRRFDIQLQLGPAINRGEFIACFQPQVDIQSERVVGFEALSRWQRDGALVSPAEFVPIAEQTGLITEIDLHCLHAAVRQAVQWQEEGFEDLTISVNLSPRNFQNDKIVSDVRSALSLSGLPPDRLVLEVTESMLVHDMAEVTGLLRQLSRLGVQIALDDFGSGYSNLGYLQMMPVDEVKIDQSLVRGIENKPQNRVILDHLIDMMTVLDKCVLVEGIETEVEAGIFRQLGCSKAQGYFYGRPMTRTEATDWLRRRQGLAARGVAS